MKRIKYCSRFAQPLSPEDIADLAARAASKNREFEVTGVLMTSGGLFFQVIEGPEHVINQLYHEIQADERHEDILLLSEETNVQTRLFPKWSMKKVDLNESAGLRVEPLKTILRLAIGQQRVVDELKADLERGFWSELVGAGLPTD
ncbi:MAG: BLUF domain-containing protein [Deltaproteobacteria bacterium]|nr:BLUF domain-containing protein [Deltaproteobacteria bacterium]